jgi:predicted lipoprotein
MEKWTLLLCSLVIGLMAISLGACKKEGPAEKAGEQVDQAVEETREELEQAGEAMEEKFDKQGPAEEAGEKIDEALEPGN